ncbi:DinB family protein [Actinomadura decatromicini]|uniref:DinB family protein n=1 Tax=Actinomadura decatromicini TaxID=2604572 RepID=A0A5D3FT36_9ACTN|nr:DinB family protein [Actinomadura decatromicini]TYK50920.1 DinB family protein [Actinomadura decatromicini]
MTTEPPDTLTAPRELLLGYLDYYRAALLRKLDGMPDADLRTSRLPSGWTPLGLLKHLAFVERRWFRWGFAAERVDEIWGEQRPGSSAWHADESDTLESLQALFLDECARSRAIVASADLQDTARTGGAFNPPDHHPALIWILFHVLQEYARHLGHLDIVRELTDTTTGE